MEKLTSKDVLHVAKLAQLELSPAQAEEHVASFNQILDYVEKLNELDTEKVAEAFQVFPAEHPQGLPQVADTPQTCLAPEEATQNAPEKQDTFFKIPRVIESN